MALMQGTTACHPSTFNESRDLLHGLSLLACCMVLWGLACALCGAVGSCR